MVSATPIATADESNLFVINAPLDHLTTALKQQLAPGIPLNASVVWVHGDSEVVFHTNKLRLSFLPGLVLIEVTLETDQTGASVLVVPFSMGKSPADATLTAVTEALPRGDPLLAARWGEIVQNELWDGLLNVGQDYLRQRRGDASLVVGGLYTGGQSLSFIITRPFSAKEVSDYYTEIRRENPELEFSPLEPPELTHVNIGEELQPQAHDDLRTKFKRLCALLRDIWHALHKAVFDRKRKTKV